MSNGLLPRENIQGIDVIECWVEDGRCPEKRAMWNAPYSKERNEIDVGQAILPGIIKKWLNGLCNLQHYFSLCPTHPSTSSLCKTRLGGERKTLWVECCWWRMSNMAFPSYLLGREKRSCLFPNPPNGKRASNMTLRDLEDLPDIVFLSLGYVKQCTCWSVPCTYTCRGEKWRKMTGQSVFLLLGGAKLCKFLAGPQRARLELLYSHTAQEGDDSSKISSSWSPRGIHHGSKLGGGGCGKGEIRGNLPGQEMGPGDVKSWNQEEVSQMSAPSTTSTLDNLKSERREHELVWFSPLAASNRALLDLPWLFFNDILCGFHNFWSLAYIENLTTREPAFRHVPPRGACDLRED